MPMASDEIFDEEDYELRVFTLSEARGLMPRLRKLLSRVMNERDALLDMRAEIDRAREKATEGGGGSPFGAQYLAHLIAFSEAVQEIRYLGVQVKDFRTGLVDFPY